MSGTDAFKLKGKEPQIIELYKSGESPYIIAQKFRCAPPSVYRVLYKAGVVRSQGEACSLAHKQGKFKASYKKKRRCRLNDEEIVKLYQEGKTPKEISQIAGITSIPILERVHKLGIARTRKEAMAICKREGRFRTPWQKGENHSAWKGGRFKEERGYIRVYAPEHPKARRKGYVMEHILMWEKAHGQLPEGYIIHHINGIRDDNRPENLIALPKNEHSRISGKVLKNRILELEAENQRLRELTNL